MRKQDAAFAAMWDDALEEAADWLELEALRRAMDGTDEGRYFRGEIIGTITRYSDSLLMFLLKARRLAVFGNTKAKHLESAHDEDSLELLRRELETKWRMTVAERRQFIESLGAEQIELLLADWPLWARRKQMPPDGDWRIWLLLAGRGFGKTRTGSKWVRRLAGVQSGSMLTGQIGLVGNTFDDVRHVMVEGPAGILAISPRWARPDWQPSQR